MTVASNIASTGTLLPPLRGVGEGAEYIPDDNGVEGVIDHAIDGHFGRDGDLLDVPRGEGIDGLFRVFRERQQQGPVGKRLDFVMFHPLMMAETLPEA